MNCYGKDSYEVKMEKQALIKKGMHLLNSKCCDKDCDVLIKDVEKTAEDCHDLFRNMHEWDDLDLDGKILTDSLCSELEEKKIALQEFVPNKAEGIFKNSRGRKGRSRGRKGRSRGRKGRKGTRRKIRSYKKI